MKVFKNIDNRLKASSNWILNTPESLTILMLMGTGIASLAFTSLSIASFLNDRAFFGILFAFFVWGSGSQFIKIFKLTKQFGLKNALGGFTANEFVWKKNKYGGKLDGTSRYSGDEMGSGRDEEKDGRFGKEIRDIYRKSE